MTNPDQQAYTQATPKCFLIFLAIIEILAALVLIVTELGNVSTNFWTTNVFAGGWCGLVMLIHAIAICAEVCCCVGPKAAFRTVIIGIIGLIACATLISFDAVFIAQPSTCILTSSCAANSASTTVFSYNLQQNFFTLFNNLGPFKTYTQTQAKFLFQTIQLGVGCLCFVLCLIHIIIYYVIKNKASKRVVPSQQPNYYAPKPAYQQQQQQQPGNGYRQPPPGNAPYDYNRRY